MTALNLAVFRWINHWPEAFAPMMHFFSEALNQWAGRILLLVVLVGMLWRGARSRAAVIQALLAFPLANLLTDQFKHFMPDPRPFQELGGVILRVGWSPSAGSASAHSANMAAVATVMMLRLGSGEGKRYSWALVWVVVAILVGLSRIYNGAHYPYQVLLGWGCGVGAGFLIVKAWDEIVRRRQVGSLPDAPGARTGDGSLSSK